MGGGLSRQSNAPAPASASVKKHPEDADKPGLLFPGKDSFVSDDFTRWSVPKSMEIVFEKFEEMVDKSQLQEHTILAVINDETVDPKMKWNGNEISPNVDYIKAFIIDYNPTKKGVDNLHIYSYLVQAKYRDNIDQYLQEIMENIAVSIK